MANLSCRLISTLRPINSIASCLSRTTFRPTNNCRKLSPTICSLNSSISQCRSFSVSSWRYQKLNSDEDSLNTVNELRKVLKKVARKRRTVTDVEDAPSVDPKTWAVDAYSTAEEYNLEKLLVALKEQGLYHASSMTEDINDVLHVSARYQVDREPREIYFFSEGSVVFWNVSDVEQKNVLLFLKTYEEGGYEKPIILEGSEKMLYTYTQVLNKTTLKNSKILLNTEGSTDLEKYTFSNALALSVKLATWEASLDIYAESLVGVVKDLKLAGKIRLSRNQVLKKQAELFALKHAINLSSDLLNTPDFYWDRENLETLYHKTCNHLDIPKRTKVMNERLYHCADLVKHLSHELSDAHHVRLEWLIIVLIAVEVSIAILKIH